MGELNLLPGLVVAAAGILAGIVLALMQRDGGDGDEAEARRRDLEQQKDQALQALRDLDDLQGARGVQATSSERTELQRRAAEALRALDKEASAPPPPPTQAGGLVSARAQGFLGGAAAVCLIGAIGYALDQGTSERTEGMSITGAAPEPPAARPTPVPGETGGAVAGVPPNLAPKSSPKVDAARAAVAAKPKDPEAWTELGWALVDAEGWIDVWNVAGKLLELSPADPDGLTLQATVRLAMGMDEAAMALVDQALVAEPEHLMALSWKGSLLLRSGDREGAKATWRKAAELEPKGGFEELILLADKVDLDRARPAPPGDHPPPSEAPSEAAAGGNRVSGTIVLADGATPPEGGVIFVIARPPGVTRGPPVASRKLSAAAFPVSFDLGDEHVMMGGAFPSRVDLTARLDGDSNAMTKAETDLNSAIVGAEAGGSVVLTLQ